MRLISLARAEDGTLLGRDVLIGRADGVPLLRAGVTLTPRYRELLDRAGISAIYVEDELSDGIVGRGRSLMTARARLPPRRWPRPTPPCTGR